MSRKARRWGDNDRYFGPITVSRGYKSGIDLFLSSGDDDYPGASLRLSVGRWTVIVALPQRLCRPARKPFTHDGSEYHHTHEREYGFYISRRGYLGVRYGAQTGDSRTEQSWGHFIGFMNWRHVRHSHYDLDGSLFWTEPQRMDYRKRERIMSQVQSTTFNFLDFDGEAIRATCRIEEREWRFGDKWFKWLSVFRAPRIRRSLSLDFSAETGKEKGSWKGGTLGHGIDMRPDEVPLDAFRRYCAEHEMTIVEESAVAAL